MSVVRGPAAKFGAFFLAMLLATTVLFMVFSPQYSSDTNTYSAVFADASSLKEGQSVRVAGIRVGTVSGVSLRPDKTVVVTFDADRATVLTTGTRAVVRYLNLVGDRSCRLTDPGRSHGTGIGP